MGASALDVKWIFEKIRKLDFLTYSSDEEMIKLVQSMKKVCVEPGSSIIRQGQKGEAYYLIRRGKVAVWAETPEGRKRLAALQDGDFFGEVSILTGEVCNATVTADGDAELFCLPPRALRKLVKANPTLAEKMAEAVAWRKGARELGLEPRAASREDLLGKIKKFLCR